MLVRQLFADRHALSSTLAHQLVVYGTSLFGALEPMTPALARATLSYKFTHVHTQTKGVKHRSAVNVRG